MLAVGAALAVTAPGCATNPVTGESELALVSEAQEIEMGRDADRQIVASMGLVEDEALQSYVSELGTRMARSSERPELPWTFRVVDDPTVNAFALPGGFIYVTRGMMSHLTSEAQLVGILGHEIGHVTARHSVSQISRSQLASLGLGLGMIFAPEELQPLGQVAGAGLQLLFLKFSRDDESQSDELGVRYMTRIGYDAAELADVFAMLERLGEDSGAGVPAWASTHPAPGDRRESILAQAEAHPDAQRVARPEYHSRVNGMLFGPDPREGFFHQGVFHHPELRFRLNLPSQWSAVNTRSAVQAISEDERAALVLTLAETSSPREALSAFQRQDGVVVTDAVEREVNGIPAVWAAFRVAVEQGELRGTIVFPALDDRVYAIYGYSGASDWSRYERTVTGSLASFQRETDSSVLGVEPNRVDVVDVPSPMALGQFLERFPSSVPEPTVALINQVEEGEQVPEGPAKRVVSD
jgi:predicted Zn-dependent protease